jgi:hypothetical protein
MPALYTLFWMVFLTQKQTIIDINNAGLIKPEDNLPFTKEEFVFGRLGGG